jgi:predicted GNAT family acetyltransferase
VSHGAGCVAYVATHSDHRGRGIGELVSRAATNAGFDLGASFVHLQASPMGEHIYSRIGYQEVGRCRILLAT